jgi:hypothetical protein
VAHRREVVDLVRLHLLDDPDQVRRIREVAVVQHEALMIDVRVLVEVVDAVGVEERSASLDAVHLVALVKEELRKVGAVLPVTPVTRAIFVLPVE